MYISYINLSLDHIPVYVIAHVNEVCIYMYIDTDTYIYIYIHTPFTNLYI